MNLYEAAVEVGTNINVPPEIIYAQWCHESANGTSPSGTYNYGGIVEWEGTGKAFHDFESMEDYADYMSRYYRLYDGAAGSQTPEEFIHALKSGGYMEADEAGYLKAVKQHMADHQGEFAESMGLNYDLVQPNTSDQSVTNTDNLRPESIYGANLLGQYMMDNFGVQLSLTGGAEKGFHAASATGHGHEDGWKIDVDGAYIVSGTAGGNAFKEYCNSQGWSCNWENDHWDIDFSGSDTRDPQAGTQGFSGNFMSGMFGQVGDTVANSVYSYKSQLPVTPVVNDEPSWWDKFSTGFMDTFTTSGVAYVAQSIWANLAHSSNPWKITPATQEDIDFVKTSLADDEEAQQYCLSVGRNSGEIRWLVNQKLVDKKREEDIEKWNDGCLLTIANAGRFLGMLADPTILLPYIGAEVKGAQIIARVGLALKNVPKAARIAEKAGSIGIRAGVMGANAAGGVTVNNVLKAQFGNEKPNYGTDAALAFVGGSILGGLGGVFRALRKGDEVADIATKADVAETKALEHAADIDKISSETINESLKLHDVDFGKQLKSKMYDTLEQNKKLIAGTYEDMSKLVARTSGIDLPANTKAFYVPNEDYMVIIKDNVKPKEVENLIAHEMGVHAGLQKTLAPADYTKLMDEVTRLSNKEGHIFNQARQKANSYDPEEILAYAAENDMLPKGITSKLKGMLNKAFKDDGLSAKFTQEQVKDLVIKQAESRRFLGEIHYNADGSTAFGGLRYSQDNLLNPALWEKFYQLEKDITTDTQVGVVKPLQVITKAMENGAAGEMINSPSNTIRGLANRLVYDPRGRGLGNVDTVSAETARERIVHLLTRPYLDYAKVRQKWCTDNGYILKGRTGRLTFDRMVVDSYNAKYGGNTANAIQDVPKEVEEAVEHLKRMRDLQIKLGKTSSKDLGSKADNLIEADWKAVDEEFTRLVSNDKRISFLSRYIDMKEAEEDLAEYIRRAAKRDVIEAKIIRGIEKENKKIDEMNATIPPNSNIPPKPHIPTTVTSKDIDDWIETHIPKAVEHYLHGKLDVTDEKNLGELGNLSFLRERIPMDTTTTMNIRGHEFSFDEDLRDFDLDAIIQKNISRFAGEAAIKAVFGTEKKLQNVLVKVNKELQMAVRNKAISAGQAESQFKHFKNTINELRGVKPEMDMMGKLGALTRLARNLAYVKNGANMGFNQLGELGGSMVYGGASQIMRVVPQLGRLMENIKHGKVEAKALRDIEDYVFGSTLESQIWTVNWGDRVIREALSANTLGNKAIRTAGDLIANMSKVTSSVNMLPQMTDSMVRGMRVQTIADTIRWSMGETFSKWRNPFTASKLKAVHIDKKDVTAIKDNLQKYVDIDNEGRLKGLDVDEWQKNDPVSFMKWYGLVEAQAERAITSGTRIGNRNFIKELNPMTQMLFQFKDFSLRAINAQTLRGLTAKDVDDGLSASVSVLTNIAAYTARAGLVYAGMVATGNDKKAQEYLDNMFSNDNLLRVAAFRSTMMGSPLSFVNDLYEAMEGASTIRTTVTRTGNRNNQQRDMSDIAGDVIAQLPAVREVSTYTLDLANVIHNASQDRMTKRDLRNLFNLLPIPKAIPMTLVLDRLVNESGLPDKRPQKPKEGK